MSKRWMVVSTALILLAVGSGVWYFGLRSPAKTPTPMTTQKFINLTINLKDGRLVDPMQTFLVQQGIGLQITINSNKFGRVSVPTDPPQTISFTQSPLIFHFVVNKLGTYALNYQADGSSKVIQIATIEGRPTQ